MNGNNELDITKILHEELDNLQLTEEKNQQKYEFKLFVYSI